MHGPAPVVNSLASTRSSSSPHAKPGSPGTQCTGTSKRLRRTPGSVPAADEEPNPAMPVTRASAAAWKSSLVSAIVAGVASAGVIGEERTRSAMSAPHGSFGVGSTHEVTFFHPSEGAVVSAAVTQKSFGLAGVSGNEASHRAVSSDVPAIQWRTVSTTFELTSVPEQRTAGAVGPPVAIATANVVVRSRAPPSTACAGRATTTIAAASSAAAVTRTCRFRSRRPSPGRSARSHRASRRGRCRR